MTTEPRRRSCGNASSATFVAAVGRVAALDTGDYLGKMSIDTDERARAAQLAALRRLGPGERMRLAAEMSEAARLISIEGERRRHPELSAAEARRVVLERAWGPDLAQRVRLSSSHR
jgi:hypothetical protein